MGSRMFAIVTTLWLTFVAGISILAMNAAHFSPWEFVIPSADPLTWICPLALFVPASVLIAAKFIPEKTSQALGWVAILVMLLPVGAILAITLFPVATGYYDPNDPERQPDEEFPSPKLLGSPSGFAL